MTGGIEGREGVGVSIGCGRARHGRPPEARELSSAPMRVRGSGTRRGCGRATSVPLRRRTPGVSTLWALLAERRDLRQRANYLVVTLRGRALQAGGRGFKSHRLHQPADCPMPGMPVGLGAESRLHNAKKGGHGAAHARPSLAEPVEGATCTLSSYTVTTTGSRRKSAQVWIGHDPVEIAAALADDNGPAHPLWPAFARSQQIPGSAAAGARWMAAGPAEPIGPDLEVVQLVGPTSAQMGHRCPPLTLLLRLGPRGWQVAGHGRVPVKTGWPPGQR